MMIPGHLSVAYLAAVGVARRRGPARNPFATPALRSEVIPVLLGSLTPDLIDKPMVIAGLSIYGRTVGHSLVFFLACLLIWVWARRVGWEGSLALGMWVLGIATHLAADAADQLVQGLLTGSNTLTSWFGWPFWTPYTWRLGSPIALMPALSGVAPLEVAVVLLAIWMVFRTIRGDTLRRRQGRPAP